MTECEEEVSFLDDFKITRIKFTPKIDKKLLSVLDLLLIIFCYDEQRDLKKM